MIDCEIGFAYEMSACCDRREPCCADGGFLVQNEALRIAIRKTFLSIIGKIIAAYEKEDFIECNNQNVRNTIKASIDDMKLLFSAVEHQGLTPTEKVWFFDVLNNCDTLDFSELVPRPTEELKQLYYEKENNGR